MLSPPRASEPPSPCGRACLALLALICAGGLLLRILMARLNVFPTVDGVMYMDQAAQLVGHGRLPFSCFPPGWPALICLPLLFMDAGEPMSLLRAAQGANVVLGAALPLLTFVLARRRLGPGPAVAAAAIMAFLPQNVVLSKGDLSENAYACALLGAWLLLERGRRPAAGLLFGYAYLIRPEAVLAAAGLGLLLLRRDRRVPWSFAVPAALCILPYLIYIKAASGHWGVSSKDVALTLSLQAHPGLSYLGLIGRNVGALLPHLTGLLGLPLVLLAVYGIACARGAWLWMFAPLLPVPFIINPMVVRFWQPYLPYLLLAAGLGGRSLAARLGAGRSRPNRRRGWRAAVAGGSVAVLGTAGLIWAAADDLPWIRRNTEAFYGLKDAGQWLRPQVDDRTLIAAYKPYASFWAGCRFIKCPDEGNTELLVAWARNHGADYMIVNALVASTLAPGLQPLLQSPLPEHLAQTLTLVQTFEYDLDAHDTLVYKIRKRTGAPRDTP